MIKTIIVGGVIISFIGIFLTPEIISIILQFKWSIIYYISMVLSRLAITVVMLEIAWWVFNTFLRKL